MTFPKDKIPKPICEKEKINIFSLFNNRRAAAGTTAKA